jgi:hypothetical protein
MAALGDHEPAASGNLVLPGRHDKSGFKPGSEHPADRNGHGNRRLACAYYRNTPDAPKIIDLRARSKRMSAIGESTLKQSARVHRFQGSA